MRKTNRRGGAAIVAVLIMIIIIAVGCALMVVTGRNSINVNESVEAPMPAGYDDKETTPQEDSETSSEAEQPPETIQVEETKPSILPQIASTYETIDLEDATFNSAVLLDCETNEIIAGYKYDKKIYPASLTKLLTLLVAAENIDDMDATYTFTDEDLNPLYEENASMAGFQPGEEVTMEDLLYAAITVSGADGTLGLANTVAGSEEEFVKMMNNKITELGLSNTSFVNASGLHDKQHYSSAQDIAAITKACMDNDICRKVLCTEQYTTSETEEHEDGIVLDSIFHGRYGGYWIDIDQDGEADADILGGKTGFTDEAMYTLSTIIDADGHEYICVVTKCMNDYISVEDTISVFENYLPGAVGTVSEDDDEENTDDDSSENDDRENLVIVVGEDSSDNGYED